MKSFNVMPLCSCGFDLSSYYYLITSLTPSLCNLTVSEERKGTHCFFQKIKSKLRNVTDDTRPARDLLFDLETDLGLDLDCAIAATFFQLSGTARSCNGIDDTRRRDGVNECSLARA